MELTLYDSNCSFWRQSGLSFESPATIIFNNNKEPYHLKMCLRPADSLLGAPLSPLHTAREGRAEVSVLYRPEHIFPP